MKWKKTEVVILQNGTNSAAFVSKEWSIFYMALFPNMDAGDIGLELSIDGTNFYPVIDPVDGADVVLLASGADPGWVDFSDWIRAFPENELYQVRFTCVSQTTAAVTVTVLERG